MKKQSQTLAKYPPQQLERFLVELANLREDHGAIKRLRERFAAFIPRLDPSWVAKFAEQDPEVPKPQEVEYVWPLMLKHMICNLWTEPDFRQMEWGAFALRYVLYRYEHDALADENPFTILEDPAKAFRVPPPAPFERALTHLVKSADVARYCANPECPAPYFFAKRRNQRYCSEICAAPAQRELKRKWWAEHGEEWRAARQGTKLGRKGAGKGKTGKPLKRTTKRGKKEGK